MLRRQNLKIGKEYHSGISAAIAGPDCRMFVRAKRKHSSVTITATLGMPQRGETGEESDSSEGTDVGGMNRAVSHTATPAAGKENSCVNHTTPITKHSGYYKKPPSGLKTRHLNPNPKNISMVSERPATKTLHTPVASLPLSRPVQSAPRPLPQDVTSEVATSAKPLGAVNNTEGTQTHVPGLTGVVETTCATAESRMSDGASTGTVQTMTVGATTDVRSTTEGIQYGRPEAGAVCSTTGVQGTVRGSTEGTQYRMPEVSTSTVAVQSTVRGSTEGTLPEVLKPRPTSAVQTRTVGATTAVNTTRRGTQVPGRGLEVAPVVSGLERVVIKCANEHVHEVWKLKVLGVGGSSKVSGLL